MPEGSQWKHAPIDTPREDGATDTPTSQAPRRRPARAQARSKKPLVVGLVITIVLVLAAATGGYLWSKVQPAATVTQTQVANRTPFKMELPASIGEYSRDASDGQDPHKGEDGKVTLSATYAKGGRPAFVLMLARPYSETRALMTDLNMNAVAEQEDGLCGTSGDNNLTGCSVIRDDTGIVVVSQVDTSRADLMKLTDQIALAIAGQ